MSYFLSSKQHQVTLYNFTERYEQFTDFSNMFQVKKNDELTQVRVDQGFQSSMLFLFINVLKCFIYSIP